MTTQTNPKCHGLRSKTPLDILRARIADTCAKADHYVMATDDVTIPMWVALELKQALEKQ